MRRIAAYLKEMGKAGLTHDEVERLIRGSGPFQDSEQELARLLVAIRASAPEAATKPGFASTLAQTASRSAVRPTSPRRVLAVGVAAALIFALAGVAMAADGAYPGHPLHGIDRALEKVGIGNGGSAERLAEVQVLLDNGKLREAEIQLDELAAKQPPPRAANTTESVAGAVVEKKEFIEDNKGAGEGVDGRDFAEGVVERTPGHQATPPGQEKKQESGSPEEGVEPNQAEGSSGDTASEPAEPTKQTGPPDHAGPPENAGAPQNAGPSENSNRPEHAGPPDHAGPKKANDS